MQGECKAFQVILNLNTRLFRNCLIDIDDVTAMKRMDDNTNPPAFIASHVLDARFFIAKKLKIDAVNPFDKILTDIQTIRDVKSLPPVREILKVREVVAQEIERKFVTITKSELYVSVSFNFPVDDKTLSGGIAFLLQHESYHIGQMAFLRRQLGLPAMSYK